MSATNFKAIIFKKPLQEHKTLPYLKYDEAEKQINEIDNSSHEWEHFGDGKYSRYAVSIPLGIARGLSIEEFYG